MDDDIYKQYILTLYRNMQNKHILADAQYMHEGYNASCGDKVVMYMNTAKDGRIEDVSFTGDGCILSQISAELLAEECKGKQIECIEKMNLEMLLDLIGIHPTAARLPCIALALQTCKGILKSI